MLLYILHHWRDEVLPPSAPFGFGGGAIELADGAYFFRVCHLLLDGPKFTTTGEFGGELLHVNRNHVGTYLIMQNKIKIERKKI